MKIKDPAINEVSGRKEAPISLTILGLLEYLSNLFGSSHLYQQDTTNQSDTISLIDKIAKNHQEKILLFKHWQFFENQEIKLVIQILMEKYFYDANKDCHFALARSLEDERSEVEKEEIDKLVEYVLYKSLIQPSADELEDYPELKDGLPVLAKNSDLSKFVEKRFHHQGDSISGKRIVRVGRRILKARLEKMQLLSIKLAEKIGEFSRETGVEPIFSSELEDFVNGNLLQGYIKGEISEEKAKKVIKRGYSAWIGLTLILLLVPSQFKTVNEKLEIQAAENKLEFSISKKLPSKWKSPSFVFYSDLTNSWIGMAVGMSVDFLHRRPDIWINKATEAIDLTYFGVQFSKRPNQKVFLIEPEEQEGWLSTKMGGGRIEFQHLKEFVIQFNPICLFAVSWSKEKDHPNILDPKIKILNGAGFNQKRLSPILRVLESKD